MENRFRNPNSQPLKELPLLNSMEKKRQCINSSHTKPVTPVLYKSYIKKHKQHHQPFQPILIPNPQLVSPSAHIKNKYFSKNMQPGAMVYVQPKSLVQNFFINAKWEPLVLFKGKHFFPHLVSEFYSNLGVGLGLNNTKFLTSVVNGRNILIDHHLIDIALTIAHKVSSQKPIDIYEKFVFNKNEFQIYVGFFCDCDIPEGMFEVNVGISYEHFQPMYQLVAMILRANILPKPGQELLFDFFDLKVMFELVTNKISFSMSYLILLNMWNASRTGFMPYGLLLTFIFEYLGIDLQYPHSKRVTSFISEKNAKSTLPLSNFVPHEHVPVSLPSSFSNFAELLVRNETLENRILELSNQFFILQNQNIQTTTKLETVSNLLASSMGRNETLENDVAALYQVNMSTVGHVGETSGQASHEDHDMLPNMEDLL